MRSKNLLIFTCVVGLQGATGYLLTSRKEYIPPTKPLNTLSKNIGGWQMVKEWEVEPEVQAVLLADDAMTRHYVSPEYPPGVGLFVAFFRSQRAGVAPHSPKNCLPGAGWVKEKSEVIQVSVPGRAEPVEANYFVVQRGENKSVVIYWYQSHGRTVADEFKAKFFVMADAMRYNRTDTALVRVTVAVGPGGETGAEAIALDFVKKFYSPLSEILPN